MRELAAQKLDEAAGTRAAVGAQQTHAVEKNPQIKQVHIFEDGGVRALLLLLFYFAQEGDQCGVEFPWKGRFRRLFVDDSRAKRLVSLGQGFDGGEDVGVDCGRLDGAELRDREGQRGHELLMGVYDILGNFVVEQGSVRRQRALVPVLIAMCRD